MFGSNCPTAKLAFDYRGNNCRPFHFLTRKLLGKSRNSDYAFLVAIGEYRPSRVSENFGKESNRWSTFSFRHWQLGHQLTEKNPTEKKSRILFPPTCKMNFRSSPAKFKCNVLLDGKVVENFRFVFWDWGCFETKGLTYQYGTETLADKLKKVFPCITKPFQVIIKGECNSIDRWKVCRKKIRNQTEF